MAELFLPILATLFGFIALVWSADRFVGGAAAIATNFGVSRLVIGLTIVSFGTSAPEMLVSATAALTGTQSLAVGNALGSNIANIALVLGLAAMLMPLRIHSNIVRRELPILLAVTTGVGLMTWDNYLSRFEGIALLSGLALLLGWSVRQGLKDRNNPEADALEEELDDDEIPNDMPTSVALTWFVVGLIVLLISSRALVWGAVEIARFLEVSELVIGLTIVAFGTSLPELAATIVAAKRNEHDIAVANVVGSNLFNLLGVLGLPGIIAPSELTASVRVRDYPAMFVLTVALFVMARWVPPKNGMSRFNGAKLFMFYCAYILWIYL